MGGPGSGPRPGVQKGNSRERTTRQQRRVAKKEGKSLLAGNTRKTSRTLRKSKQFWKRKEEK